MDGFSYCPGCYFTVSICVDYFYPEPYGNTLLLYFPDYECDGNGAMVYDSMFRSNNKKQKKLGKY